MLARVAPAIALLLLSTEVSAQTATTTISPGRRALAAGAALVPGAALHGLGHLAIGDRETMLELVAVEGAAILLGGAGGAVLALSGASRKLVLPATLAAIGGVGLFVLSYAADLYGVLADGGLGRPRTDDPWIEAQLGLAHVYDPTFDYRFFLTAGGALWFDRFALEPNAWIALDDDNARMSVGARYRVLRASRRGSYFDVRGAYTHHRYGSAGFSTNTYEIELGGRLDLSWLSPTMAGAFAEGGLGLGLEHDRFYDQATEANGLLLGRFGFGLYLGRGGSDGSELLVYYDHRHDGFAGGTKLPGLFSGVFGSFGLAARWDFSPSYGAVLDARTGSAHVLGLSFVYREGGAR